MSIGRSASRASGLPEEIRKIVREENAALRRELANGLLREVSAAASPPIAPPQVGGTTPYQIASASDEGAAGRGARADHTHQLDVTGTGGVTATWTGTTLTIGASLAAFEAQYTGSVLGNATKLNLAPGSTKLSVMAALAADRVTYTLDLGSVASTDLSDSANIARLNAANTFSAAQAITGSNATGSGLSLGAAGNAVALFAVRLDGRHDWSDGTNAADTNLYRSAADTLQTDDTLVCAGLRGVGALGVTAGGNAQAITVRGSESTTPGTAGGSTTLSGGPACSSGAGGPGGSVFVAGAAAALGDGSVDRAGGNVSITGGTSVRDSSGGTVAILGGTGGTGSGTTGSNGGASTFTGGTGGVGSALGGNGGAITLQGGAAAAAPGSAGGAALVQGRAGATTGSGGNGGSMTIVGGAAGGDNTVNRTGGAVAVTAGASKGNSTGGAVTITAGAGGPGANGTNGVAGGAVTINGGLGGDGSSSDGAGGAIVFRTAATLTLAECGRFTAAGQLQLPITGSGAGILIGGDTNLYRGAANVIQTDDTLRAGGLTTDGTNTWTLAGYTAGAPTVEGYLTVTVGGTTYRIACEQV